MLQHADMAIDAIQSAKLTWLFAFIKEEKIRSPLVDFVEAQRKFTKQIAKSTWEITGAAADSTVTKIFSTKI